MSLASGIVPVDAGPPADATSPVADLGGADDPSSVTVARRPRPAPATPEPERPSARRRWIAAGAAVVAVGATVAGIVILGGGDDGGGDPDVPATSARPPDDTFYDALAVPGSVRVTAAGEGRFAVDLTPVDGATAYEITPVNAAIEPVTVTADELPATVVTDDGANLCVMVRAVGEGGRISRDSDPVCAD